MAYHSQGKTEKCLLFAPSVLTFSLSELDPFLQHMNKELKEKEIQAAATNPKITHQLKVSVAWLSRSQGRKALSEAAVLGFSSFLECRVYTRGG